jgi:hypothetical protein
MRESARRERCPPDSSDSESFQQSPNPTFITNPSSTVPPWQPRVSVSICTFAPAAASVFGTFLYWATWGGSNLALALGRSVWKIEEKSRFTCVSGLQLLVHAALSY